MDKSLRTTEPTNTTANDQLNQGKRVGGFQGKRHDLATKNKISQTQKARYDYMRQMMRQHQQNEQSQQFGAINVDSPILANKIKDIVREILKEEVNKAIPTRRNIPIL